MKPASEALPDDIAALRALLLLERAERLRADAEAARLQTEAAHLQREVARLTALTERLDHIIAQLRRLQFGKRSEALDPDQLKLGLEDLESAAAEVEAEIRGQDADTRKTMRQARSRPLVLDLRPWLEARLTTVAGRSPLAEAIRYTLARWDGLTRFLGDGRIELDSNPVERSIRQIALNRKNALFAGSDQGGVHWGVIASLIETCKLNAVDPQAYLADVLSRLVNRHPASQIDQLMPWAYAN